MHFNCPRCGETLAADEERRPGNATGCPTCGHKFIIPLEPPSTASPSQSPIRTFQVWRIGVIVVVVLCVGLLIVMKFPSHRAVPLQQSGARSVAQASKSHAPDIDLISATVYGKPVFKLGLDELTDLMGRPSGIKSPTLSGVSEAYLIYADKGLVFSFNDPSTDSRQTCNAFRIFLESTHTTEDGGPFVAFHGSLSYGLNGQWKVKDVSQAFAAYNPHDPYDAATAALGRLSAQLAAQMGEWVKEAQQRPGTTPRIPPVERDVLLTSIIMTFPDHNVGIEYEENTKFLKCVDVVHTDRR
jgi:DNA-directed RNA polymerase subunit RPC12/RpoP